MKIKYDTIGCNYINEVRELVLENIEYEYIRYNHDRQRMALIIRHW